MVKVWREGLLVLAIVVIVAGFVRWDAIPAFPDRHVAGFEETYRVDVVDPGPWFSAWALGDGQAYALIGIVNPTGELRSVKPATGSPGLDTAGLSGLSLWDVPRPSPTRQPWWEGCPSPALRLSRFGFVPGWALGHG